MGLFLGCIAVSCGLFEFAGQPADVFGTLLHAGGDVIHLFVRNTVETGSKNLCKATDDVKRRTYFVVHILYEGSFTTVGFEFQLGGIGQLVVLLLQFFVDTFYVADHLCQRLLHADKAVLQPAHTVASRTFGQWFVKVPIGYALGLFVKLLQGVHGTAYGLIAEE